MKAQIIRFLIILGLVTNSALIYGQNRVSASIFQIENSPNTLTDAERNLWRSMKSTGFEVIKERRFRRTSKPVETTFTMKFGGKLGTKRLWIYYFISKESLITSPKIELVGCNGIPRPSLKYKIFLQDGLIIYDVFPLELPVPFSEDAVRFTASVPGKLLVLLN